MLIEQLDDLKSRMLTKEVSSSDIDIINNAINEIESLTNQIEMFCNIPEETPLQEGRSIHIGTINIYQNKEN